MDEQELVKSLELLETLNVMHDEKMAMMDKEHTSMCHARDAPSPPQGLF